MQFSVTETHNRSTLAPAILREWFCYYRVFPEDRPSRKRHLQPKAVPLGMGMQQYLLLSVSLFCSCLLRLQGTPTPKKPCSVSLGLPCLWFSPSFHLACPLTARPC